MSRFRRLCEPFEGGWFMPLAFLYAVAVVVRSIIAVVTWLPRKLFRRKAQFQPVFCVGEIPGIVLLVCRRWLFPRRMSIMINMDTTQQFPVSISPKDRKGNAAQVENVGWQTDNSDVLDLAPSGDGLSCVVKATGMPGTARVQVTADAKIGEGEVLIVGSLDVTVTQAQATTIELVPGAVEDQP